MDQEKRYTLTDPKTSRPWRRSAVEKEMADIQIELAKEYPPFDYRLNDPTGKALAEHLKTVVKARQARDVRESESESTAPVAKP